MRKGGLEPPRVLPHYHLKVARIPFRHFRMKKMKSDHSKRALFSSRGILTLTNGIIIVLSYSSVEAFLDSDLVDLGKRAGKG